jgi:hypothetical protein
MAITINTRAGAETSLRRTAPNHKRYPELAEGVRIQYVNKDGATRSEIIARRNGNTVVVKDGLGTRSKITIDQTLGYWPDKVAPSPANLRRLGDKKELVQQQLVVV